MKITPKLPDRCCLPLALDRACFHPARHPNLRLSLSSFAPQAIKNSQEHAILDVAEGTMPCLSSAAIASATATNTAATDMEAFARAQWRRQDTARKILCHLAGQSQGAGFAHELCNLPLSLTTPQAWQQATSLLVADGVKVGRAGRGWNSHTCLALGCFPPEKHLSHSEMHALLHRTANNHYRIIMIAAFAYLQAFRRCLAARRYRVPDVEGCIAARCQLATRSSARRFGCKALNSFVAALFEALPRAVEVAGLPEVSPPPPSFPPSLWQPTLPSPSMKVRLSRFDCFHSHLFYSSTHGQLGMLFHAKEYPAYHAATFPIDLGYCQRGSPLNCSERGMDWRNIIW